MSRRKQSRPRHVDNDGLGLDAEPQAPGEGATLLQDAGADDDGEEEDSVAGLKRRNANDNDNDQEDDKVAGVDNGEEFCPSGEVPSPNGCDVISACDKCGVCFTDLSQFIVHKKLCASRTRILMPYDPPINGYLQNGYDFSRSSLDGSMGKDDSDGDDRDEFESMDEEDRSRHDTGEFENSDVNRKRKRAHGEDERNIEEHTRFRSQMRSDENFILGLKNRMTASLQNLRDRRADCEDEGGDKNGRLKDEDEEEEEEDEDDSGKDSRRKRRRSTEGERSSPSGCTKVEDPAITWAMKAAERGVFGANSNVTLEPLAATSAAVAQSGDGLASRTSVPEEVNMFRTMLFQLQQQQMMQIQMIQQMRRQLIATGVNPAMLPADVDLNMMSSEGLATVGAAMSGLQNVAAAARDSGKTASSGGYHGSSSRSRSPSHGGRSRESSPSPSESFRRGNAGGSAGPSSPAQGNSASEQESDRGLREAGKASKEEPVTGEVDISEKYLSPLKPLGLDSSLTKEHISSSPLTRNPLEILQEKTAASFSSLPLPLGMRSSTSTDSKPYSSSSSLLNSSALFASSPSLSALQKETDALKPSPILPPMSYPMTAEDYKGYIQRGTILERSQYASDDPFFKHKCRFCHKVFGSDSALQIHVRSHTGERPFKCNICGNRFSTKGNLKVHFERHKAKYPHIKMDATPVPEHLDRQPHLLPNFHPTPIPPSVPLPPPMPRLPIPTAPHGPPPPPSSIPSSHPSPFPHGFGGTFVSTMAPSLSSFGLMPPPREGTMPFPYHLSLSLPSSKPMLVPLGRDSVPRRESPTKLSSGSAETSVIRSPRKDSPVSSHRDISPSDTRRHTPQHHPSYPPHLQPHYYPPHHEYHHRHHSDLPDKSDENIENNRDETKDKKHEDNSDNNLRSRSRHDSEESRSQSPVSRKSVAASVSTPSAVPSSPPIPLSRPSSSHSPRQSPASVISWASLASTQGPLLPGHHPMFPHHIPHGFPGFGLPLPGTPTSFPLPSPLNPVLPMSGPRISSHSPFLHPLPPPPPPPPQMSPPPGDGSMFRNSILPTKTIDPSENLEQYMEVQKSETSKLEALVKNIEQKITDPNQCVVCHRVLSCKSALQMHYRIHTGERPFKCKICGRSFTTKGNLKTHMGVHRAKPALRMMHQCPVCHKQFTNVLVLQQHIRAHTGSMPHMPHMPILPPHMDWAHRSPFGLNSHPSFLPPLHPDTHTLDLSRGPPFHHVHLPRRRSHSMDGEQQRQEVSPKKDNDGRQDEDRAKKELGKNPDDEAQRNEGSSRPHSPNSDGFDEKERTTSSPRRSPRDSEHHSSLTLAKPESAFLPPAFGNTPFDGPLAALEERVKAIDSHLSQTSFEKFRNSMGLDSVFYSNSMSNTNLSNGEKNSEYESESASKPESPASGGEMQSYGFPMMSGFDSRNATTCNICLKTFACKSALDVHYRSHTKMKPFECEVCDRSFSTKGNLKQHLLTHKIRDLPNSAFDDDEDEDQNGDDDLQRKEGEEDGDDDDELPNEDYPYEEDEGLDESGLDQEMDQDEDVENLTDEFNEPPPSDEPPLTPKSHDDSHEDKNNNFQDQDEEEAEERCAQDSTETENTEKNVSQGKLESAKKNVPETKSPNSQSLPPSKEKSEESGSTKTSSSGQRSAHTNTANLATRRPNGPKHQCMTCMKPFSSASALQIHTRTHTGDKPFKCTVCSKAFTTRGNLKVHMGTHMWNNSPSRRGRRMSIEPPFLLSHMKDNPFIPSGFPPRPPPDFFYQFPLPMMNGPVSKMNEISVIQSLSGALPSLPPHLLQGFLPKEEPKLSKDSRPTSESGESRDQPLQSDKKPSMGELDLSMKVSGGREGSPPPRSASSIPSSTLPLLVHPAAATAAPTASTTASSTPSPSNNKENASAALDLRNMRTTPWMWGALPCHHCGQMFPTQDSLEHHLRTHHLGKSEPAAHSLTKSESHPPPKALLA